MQLASDGPGLIALVKPEALSPETKTARRDRERAIQNARKSATKLLKNATNHGAWVFGLANAWGIPTIIAISFGAFFILAGASVQTLAQHGGNFVEWGRLGSTLVLLFAGDLAFAAALLRVQNAHEREIPWTQMLFDYTIIVVIGAMETWTYWLLLTGEGTATAQAASPTMNALRAASGILAAAYLTTLRKPRATDRDFVRVAAQRSSEMALAKLEQIPIDDTSMGTLYAVSALANDPTLTEGQRAKRLVEEFERLVPGSVKAQYTHLLAQAEAKLAHVEAEKVQALAAMQDTLDRTRREFEQTLQTQVQTLRQEAKQHLYDLAFHLMQHGTFPPDIAEQYPVLASFKLANTHAPRGPKPTAIRTPRTRNEAYSAFLEEVEIAPAKTPEGRRSVWIKSGDVGRLVDGKLTQERLRKIMRDYGNDLRDGTSLIAPIEGVMKELSALHIVAEQAAKAWQKYAPSSTESEGELSVVRGTNDGTNDDESTLESVA